MGTLRSHGLAKQKLTPELWAVKTKEKTVRVLVSQVQLVTHPFRGDLHAGDGGRVLKERQDMGISA